MATDRGYEREPGVTRARNTGPESSDPRDTDHPTGTEQAAENAANESPS
jgi:hypothetical protein